MRGVRRPLLDVVGVGSAYRADGPRTRTSLEPPKPSKPLTKLTELREPADYSLAKSAAIGGVISGSLNAFALAKAAKIGARLRREAKIEQTLVVLRENRKKSQGNPS